MKVDKEQLAKIALVGGLLVLVIFLFWVRPSLPGKQYQELEPALTPLASGLYMISPTYNPKDKSLYFFDQRELKVARVNWQGKVAYLTARLGGVEEAIFSPDFTQVILRNINDLDINPEAIAVSPLLKSDQPNQVMLTWLYDLADQKLSFVSSSYSSVFWMTRESILSLFVASPSGEVGVARPDGSDFVPFLSIPDIPIDELLAWLPGKGVLFSGGVSELDHHLYWRGIGDRSSQRLTLDYGVVRARGNLVIYNRWRDPQTLYLYDLLSKKEDTILKADSPIRDVAWAEERLLVASEKELLLYEGKTGQVYRLSLALTAAEIDKLIPSDREGVFFIVSQESLFRLELPADNL
jgi:hypothetical protein